jgi:hypothetical protein
MPPLRTEADDAETDLLVCHSLSPFSERADLVGVGAPVDLVDDVDEGRTVGRADQNGSGSARRS